jgi:hypothetical protein
MNGSIEGQPLCKQCKRKFPPPPKGSTKLFCSTRCRMRWHGGERKEALREWRERREDVLLGLETISTDEEENLK